MTVAGRFQFSLSTLLWFMLCASITFSILAIFTSRRRADREGKAAVAAVGGKVEEFLTYFWQDDRFWVDLRGTNLTDAELIVLLPKLKRMTYVYELTIDSPNVSREALPHLRGFPKLFVLDMSGTAIPIEDLEAFATKEGIPVIGKGGEEGSAE